MKLKVNSKLQFLVAALLISMSCMAQAKEMSVLFLGNSFTYLPTLGEPDDPKLPKIVWEIAHSIDPNLKLKVSAHTVGGYRLEDHARDPKSLKLLSQHYDHVILQAQSIESFELPPIWHENGNRGVDSFSVYLPKLIKLALRERSPVSLYINWGWSPRKDQMQDGNAGLRFPPGTPREGQAWTGATPLEHQAMIDASFEKHASGLPVSFAYVGDAWLDIQAHGLAQDEDLYLQDGMHPTALGAFIAALVIARDSLGLDISKNEYVPEGAAVEQAHLIQQHIIHSFKAKRPSGVASTDSSGSSFSSVGPSFREVKRGVAQITPQLVLQQTAKIPFSIARQIRISNEPAKPYAVVYKYPRQTKLNINPRLLADCLNFEMHEIGSSSGIVPTYERGGEKCMKGDHELPGPFPTLIEYLGGQPRSCDLATGQEKALLSWVLAQPENSISPSLLFAAAYRLNNGNIYSALLTVHQMLRPIARFDSDGRYFTHSYEPRLNRKLSQAVADRLIDIRGDLVERGGYFKGDHMGNWYRIWGTMLYQSIKNGYNPCSTCRTTRETITESFKQTLSAIQVAAMSIGDELILKLGQERDLRKFETDVVGSQTMNFLSLGRDQSITHEQMRAFCGQASYLQPEH